MKISYSIATELDCLGISYVIAHSWNETYKGLVSQKCLDLKIENIKSKSEKIKDYLKTSGNSYYVAKDENNVIGVVSFSKQENELYKDYGELCSIYLLKQYHGYNIGKTLLKIAVEGLKKWATTK